MARFSHPMAGAARRGRHNGRPLRTADVSSLATRQ